MTSREKQSNASVLSDDSCAETLVRVLEDYLADLERGLAPNQSDLLAAHPQIAVELGPYLEDLWRLHLATRDARKEIVATPAGPLASMPNIGEYQIIREIGRGGMGIVYEAQQESLNRRVALKVLPFAAVLDQRQIARFRNEAQAAAQLHHPNIVPVFAVGQELGVYYYAMQYIDGRTVEQLIQETREPRELTTTKLPDPTEKVLRAIGPSKSSAVAAQGAPGCAGQSEFFRTVARLGIEAALALQHAHDYGIVHRDVKPSNLLLDERGKLWVTDFGLARMQSESGMTQTGDMLGTLRYMSPEQAAGRTSLVDARTDVYSLGATLYELLTQQAVHQGDNRQSLLKQVIDDEPIPLRRHNPAVPADLETIVLTAIAKRRDERFDSAQALADDLERFLAGKPIVARRAHLPDRVLKWAQRHRPLVAVGFIAMLLITLVSAVGMILLTREQSQTAAALVKAEESARTARNNFERAEQHLRHARGAVDQFGIRLADRLLEIPGTELVRQEVLRDTLDYHRSFLDQAGDNPGLQHELALAHFKSGLIAAKLGSTSDAINAYKTAIPLLAELAQSEPKRPELWAELAIVRNNLGLLHAERSEVALARQEYDKAVEIQQRLVAQHGDKYVSQLAESQANIGALLSQTGRGEEAELALRQVIELLGPPSESTCDEPKKARDLAIAHNNLSCAVRPRDPTSAESISRTAITLLEQLVESYPEQRQYQDDLALCFNNLAAIESQLGRSTSAITTYQRAIALQEQLVRLAPAVVRHRTDLATSLSNLALTYCRVNQQVEADAEFGRARSILETLTHDYPHEVTYQKLLAALLNNRGFSLAASGRLENALAIYSQAIELQRACCERLPNAKSVRESLSKMYFNYSRSLLETGRIEDATNAVLARRKLWPTDGKALLNIAAELAELRKESETSGDAKLTDGALRVIDAEVLATLWQARDAGWPPGFDLATDGRFALYHGSERFDSLFAKTESSSTNSTLLRQNTAP